MDLPTHFFFGLAIGFVFFGHQPELALLVGLGALLPDLDREYWFIPPKKYAAEQRHRALLHNVVVIALTFAVSPFLSLGVFLHVLQDSFTTVKDRGVEWFYPFTRLAKRGQYDSSGKSQPPDPKEHVYFYQEDPPGLVKYADPDLQETLNEPVPWRRVYGFALNSHLLDRGFLFGSIAVLLIWLFVPSNFSSPPNVNTLLQVPLSVYATWLLGLVAVGVLFFSGEIDRRDRVRPIIGKLKPVKVPIFGIGIFLLSLWVTVYRSTLGSNVASVVSTPLQILTMIVLIPLIALALVWYETKGGKQNATI
ncbi:MAG TPA: metal-dependent hydrolase [Nitrososphaerales archaeon]|nr:metal-dependent hydrolase [Nitrososphaerales archaeon]